MNIPSKYEQKSKYKLFKLLAIVIIRTQQSEPESSAESHCIDTYLFKQIELSHIQILFICYLIVFVRVELLEVKGIQAIPIKI